MSTVKPQPPNRPPAWTLTVWGATDKGRQREGNEDAIFPHSGSDTFPFQPGPQHLTQRGQLLIVADGVGGARAGREASHWAIRVAVERYYDAPGPDLGANLKAAIEMANSSLYQYLQSTGTREAGCTMTAAVIHKDTLYVANVGDSRVYLLRNGQITQMTVDHTLAQQKLAHGIITPEEAKTDPGSHVLTRSMGAAETVHVDLFPPVKLAPGDVVLLCSDGLTDMVADEEIARLIGNHPPRKAAQRLIAAANRNGGVDNISVVVARVGGPRTPAGGGAAGRLDALTDWQKGLLGGLTVLLTLALCVAAAAASYAYYERRRKPTPVPTATVRVVPVTPEATAVPTDTPPPPTDTVPAGQPTSTPRPTSTPTPTYTPVPPTPTPLPTDTPTPTPIPTGGGGGGGGGGQPRPTSPPPTNTPPPPPATDTPQPR